FSITIVLSEVAVAVTVQFDDQSCFFAQKVNDEWTDRDLASELQVRQPAVSQMRPQPPLRPCHLPPESFGTLVCDAVGRVGHGCRLVLTRRLPMKDTCCGHRTHLSSSSGDVLLPALNPHRAFEPSPWLLAALEVCPS